MTSGSGSRQTAKLRSILAVTEQIMLDSGYAAVTFRSVAAQAGVAAGLVQYYFPALDDLFVTVVRGATDRVLADLAEAGRGPRPLRAIWAYANKPTDTALLMEFMALANHRAAVRSVIGEGGERVRQTLLGVVTAVWARYGLDENTLPPAAALFLLSAIPRMIHLEESLGTFTGHPEILALVDEFLDRVEPLDE